MAPFVNVLWSNPSAFPGRVGTASGGTSSLTTNPSLDLSTLPLTEGNVMVLVFRDQDAGHTGPTGWTLVNDLYATTIGRHMSVWAKTVGAAEASSQTFTKSSSSRCGWVAFEYGGAHGDVEAVVTDATLNPASLTPAWGSAKTQWVTACSVAASDNTLTAPSGYTGQVDGASAASTADSRARCAMAHRENEAASEDPGVWGASGTYFYEMSATIAVRPA